MGLQVNDKTPDQVKTEQVKAEPQTRFVELSLFQMKRFYENGRLFVKYDEATQAETSYEFEEEEAMDMLRKTDDRGIPIWKKHVARPTIQVEAPREVRTQKVRVQNKRAVDLTPLPGTNERGDLTVDDVKTPTKVEPLKKVEIGDDNDEVAQKLRKLDAEEKAAKQNQNDDNGPAVTV